MPQTFNSKPLKYNCFIDESFDTREATIRNYVVSAGIFLGDLELGLLTFKQVGLKLGFKTSRLFKVSHQENLHLMGRWIRDQEFMSISVAVSLHNWDPEVARRLALSQLFTQLNLIGIDTHFMDSRDDPGSKKQVLNSLDCSTLSFLRRSDSTFRGTRLIFQNDNSDFRFAIADFIAWSTRRAISADDHTFHNYIADRNEVFLILPEKNRGRPLPLLGNWPTPNFFRKNEAGIP